MSDPIPLEDDPAAVMINIITDQPSVVDFELCTTGHERPEGHVLSAVGLYLSEMAQERITIDAIQAVYATDQFDEEIFRVTIYTRAVDIDFAGADGG